MGFATFSGVGSTLADCSEAMLGDDWLQWFINVVTTTRNRPRNHHFNRSNGYHSQSWLVHDMVWTCFNHMISIYRWYFHCIPMISQWFPHAVVVVPNICGDHHPWTGGWFEIGIMSGVVVRRPSMNQNQEPGWFLCVAVIGCFSNNQFIYDYYNLLRMLVLRALTWWSFYFCHTSEV